MAVIYEMASGTIVSENTGVTTINRHEQPPEYSLSLQPVEYSRTVARPGPCDEYMSILKELLKDL